MKNKINNPMISIIVPIYNVEEELLKKCIESLINQTFKNIEIILVNDGSDEYVQRICMHYSQFDKRIKLINKKNGGVSSSRNIGLDNSQSKYIMFLDGDDWLEFDCLDKCYKLSKYKYDLIYFNYYKNYKYKQKKIYVGNVENSIYKMPIIGSSCMKLYSRSIIDNVRFNEKLKNGEDVDFNFKAFKNVKNPKFLNEYFYHYEIRNNSAVRAFKNDMIKNYEDTLNSIFKEVNLNNEEELNSYYSFCAICFIMICSNYIFSFKNLNSYKSKVECTKNVLSKNVFSNMLLNIDKIELPISRKIIIYFSKYNMIFLIYIVVLLKNLMNKLLNR